MEPEIIKRLESIEQRLQRLEHLAGMAYSPTVATPPKPPPVVRRLLDANVPATEVPGQSPRAATSDAKQSAGRGGAGMSDLEYQLGAKVGPIVGAIACVAALFYLVSLGLSRGWITPSMLFAGACILCGTFIGVGLWKREEKEEFGQILTGIGSCGLYLNFAAGHVYQGLYEGEGLVGLFFVLSLLNLGFSWWRASKPFLGIGLLGGLVAALMPLDQRQSATSLILNLLIVLPASLIAAKNRWHSAAVAIYIASMAAFVPIMVLDQAATTALGIYAAALMTTTSYVWADQDQKADPQRATAQLMLLLSGLFAFPQSPDMAGVGLVLAFGAIASAIGYATRDRRHGKPMLFGGALTPFVFAPFGWDHYETMWIFLGLASLAAVLSLRTVPKVLSIFSGVGLAFAAWTYLAAYSLDPLSANREATILAVCIVVTVLATHAAVRAWQNDESLVIGTSFLLVPPSVRFLQLLSTPLFDGTAGSGITFGLLVYGFVLIGVTYFLRSSKAAALMSIVVAAGLVLYALTAHDRAGDVLLDTWLALFFVCAVSLAAFVAGDRAVPSSKGYLTGFAVVLVGALLSRIGFLLLIGRMPAPSAVLLTAGVYVLSVSIYGCLRRTPGFAAASAIFWTLAILLYGSLRNSGAGFGSIEPWFLLLFLVSLPFVATALRREEDSPGLYYGVALGGWYVAGRLGSLFLGPSVFGMNENAAVTTAWISTGLVLLASGFSREIVHFRFAAFTVLFSTILKIVFVDLANTDQAIKVVILMLLGLVMLGGGYWYIHRRSSVEKSAA